MKILISHEESQAVCLAFRERGHEAYSNDLIDCSGGHPEWHLKMDCYEAIKLMKWDLIGLHPVCTKMAFSGNRHYAAGKPKNKERIEAVEWTINLWKVVINNCPHVYMENPMGAMNGDKRLPKAQVIQPWYFGDEYQKTTCLWLKGLPKLQHFKSVDLFNDTVTHVGTGEFYTAPSGKRLPKWYSDDKSAKNRSKTFPGIAKAMADQWG